MPQIRTLKDLDNGNKLGDTPANQYPPSRPELEEELSCAKKDREVAIYWGSQFADSYDVLDREHKHTQDSLNQSKKENKRIQDDLNRSRKENEKLSNRIHQLGEEITYLQSKINDPKLMDEIRQLHSEINDLKLQITRKDISLADAESKFSIKSEEMQALQFKMKEEIQAHQSRAEELERDLSLAQEELSKMESHRRKLELRNTELFTENIDLDLGKRDLEDTLIKKKDKLVQMNDNLATAQKALIEKDTLLQEAVLNNTRLAEQISKISSESEVIGGDKGLEKGIEITSPTTTSDLPYYLFFQQYGIIIVIVLLVIFIIWRIFSHRYSSNPPYNEEKNIPNYKIPLNRNQSYGFPIRYAKVPKSRTTPYKTLPYGYG
ncbi:hypothetical protein GLOIN_2v1830120 [Rhizophagus clarus]|uniref:Uncharacterized protein n=1 Tax=Rhizophagus clarus TaxID=94130 RepID=A0A8H3MH94_9GLOM|nr:hypothetical protein GLOIN_2v1830120 [Rhizophagus clarus]